LVTDYSFLREESVVWERLEDLSGSTYVDSDFMKSSPAGGDFAGHTAQSALAAIEAQYAETVVFDPAEYVLFTPLWRPLTYCFL
jgi:hypothetical protein